jgi:predicted RNA binding protein YcfA (HicA-like mRNA interferase family)
MARLPHLGGREVVKVFQSLGWELARQSGSHIVLVREGHPATLSVPATKKWPWGRCGALSVPQGSPWRCSSKRWDRHTPGAPAHEARPLRGRAS